MTTTTRFAGRAALITGAAGAGIGSAIANRLASEGAAIIAVDHHAGRTAEIVKRLEATYDVPVVGYAIDVTDRPAVDAMLAKATDAVGDIDIVINSAAINVQGSIFDYQVDDFEQVVAVDLTACWYLIRQTIGNMRSNGRGSIVNIGSVAAYNGGRGREAPYSASKAALHELTRSVAIEGGPYGIRCNAIAPGLIWSKFVEKHKARFEVEAEATPLRRHGQPEEIANVAAFLVSDESSYITGEVINVSGGWFLSP
jgi:3-oxoacyl-[acyl-carrier protein] reductase